MRSNVTRHAVLYNLFAADPVGFAQTAAAEPTLRQCGYFAALCLKTQIYTATLCEFLAKLGRT